MDIEILDWTSDLDRPSAIDALDTSDLPVCHTVSVTERRIAIDDRTLIQNNVRTDTLALDLDGEWDGVNVVVLIGKTGSEVELAWAGVPVVIPAQVAESVGAIDVSVVGYSSDGTVRLVTAEAAGAMTVIRSGALTGEVPADEAPDVLAQLLESATQARQAASTATSAAQKATASAASADAATEAAQDATSAATTATAKATEAASAANEAANTANSIIAQLPLPDGNVPRATKRGEVVSVDDAFAATPLGLKVYGNTRQNLWVNPSGTKNGVTVTPNDDGSLTVSGDATQSETNISNRTRVYSIKPLTTYTISVDKELRLVLNYYNNDGFISAVSLTSGTSRQITTIESFDYVIFAANFQPGQNKTGTYRVMLNEGSTAEPWCPPGLTSAEPTQVVVAGKNLVVPTVGDTSSSGITATVSDDGSVSLSGTSTALSITTIGSTTLPAGEYVATANNATASGYERSWFRVAAVGGNDRTLCDVELNKTGDFRKFTLVESTKVSFQARIETGTTLTNFVFRPQLELGSTATAYEPPNVTTLNLDPVELRGLPDGTEDVLDVGSGSVAREVGHIASYDGEDVGETWIASELDADGSPATGAEVIYLPDEPTTSTLTPVALPTLPSPVCNVWAVSDVPCEVEMGYIRDINVVLSRLEGAM